MIKFRLIAKLLIATFSSIFLLLLSGSINAEQGTITANKTSLQTKYYQQALYYYFQGDYVNALSIMAQSKLRLKSLDQTSLLFEAGLQVSFGLQEEAKKSLLALDVLLSNTAEQGVLLKKSVAQNHTTRIGNKSDVETLLVITLLSLSEQFITQGENTQAQQTLSKITKISPTYFPQYQVLSQLAYWPATPNLISISPLPHDDSISQQKSVGNDIAHSPYIQLNKALRFIEAQKFQQASALLESIKNMHWQAPEKTFWQLLFSNDDSFNEKSTSDQMANSVSNSSNLLSAKKTMEQRQYQAINDYARLLLAQLYVQQAQYEKAFYELKVFPQHSPYTESALFLFAFSAQQIKQYTISLSLLSLLHQQYPYSNLGWQAGELMASQVVEQKGLAQGWQAYQSVELFFVKRAVNLKQFEQNFSRTEDLLAFSITPSDENAISYLPSNIWLQQAMEEPTLNNLYQQLIELSALNLQLQKLQDKNDWLVQTIALNKQRKMRIAASQQVITQQALFEQLTIKREDLASVLNLALFDPQRNGFAFANETEQVLLDRINRSKKSLVYITDDSVKKTVRAEYADIADYQQRLARVEAVLTWQLKQQFPERAWQHKQQLAALDKSLQTVEILQNKVIALTDNNPSIMNSTSLPMIVERQQQGNIQLQSLIIELQQLQSKVSLKIREKVVHYIENQKHLLAKHLLTTRSAMANVLEKMSEQDGKIESQLNLDDKVIKEVSL